jgi:hypothetical protein
VLTSPPKDEDRRSRARRRAIGKTPTKASAKIVPQSSLIRLRFPYAHDQASPLFAKTHAIVNRK